MANIAVLTSGGDSPGMNACIRACVRYALYKGFKVYGVDRGYVGLLKDDIIEMTSRSVSDIIQRGGTILHTARCPEFKEKEYRKIAAENLRKHDIDGLIVIGGDGSFHGAQLLSNEWGINVVGIPGTIDNDLAYTDYTLGFDTAVNTVLWALNSLRDTMTSHDRVSLLQVMGRNCGDIALYAAVTGGAEYALVPEVPYDIDKIADAVKASQLRGKTSNVIILAEGAGDRNIIAEKLTERGIDVKTTTLGHIQRGGSPSMQDRLLAAKFGVRAVELIAAGKTNRVVGIKNNKIIDENIDDALALERVFDMELYNIAQALSL
mgnify:CR=1 FL=1